MKVGLGTGSTAYWAIRKLGERVAEGLNITAVATSRASEQQARELGIPLVSFGEIDRLDLTIDGADELDGELQLIKGGGGALLREKIVAKGSDRMIVIADEARLSGSLANFRCLWKSSRLPGNGHWRIWPNSAAFRSFGATEQTYIKATTEIT